MATFQASFTVTESIDGTYLTLTDTSNYGADSTHNKTNFTSRVINVIRGDNINNTTTYNFPYTNSNNTIQDTYQINKDSDYAYSITLVLTESIGTQDTANNPVLGTQFTNLGIIQLLSILFSTGLNDTTIRDSVLWGYSLIQSAIQRASVGDISGANDIIQIALSETKMFN